MSRCNVTRISILVAVLSAAVGSPLSAQPHFLVDAEILYTVGYDVGPNGEYAFTRIRHLIESGSIVHVVDENAAAVRMYDSETGTYVDSYGRNGAGPGEFRDIRSLFSRGDSLWLADRENQRLSLVVNGAIRNSYQLGEASFNSADRTLVTKDGGAVLFNSASTEYAVQCIDLDSGRLSCNWLSMDAEFPAESFPMESELGTALLFAAVVRDPETVYLMRKYYDGRIWRAARATERAKLSDASNAQFAAAPWYDARLGEPYSMMAFADWFNDDFTPRRGVKLPPAHTIYSTPDGERRLAELHSLMLSAWLEDELMVAYLLFRSDGGSDLWMNRWDSSDMELVSSTKLASTGEGNAIYQFQRAADNKFLMAWNDEGVPVWSKVHLPSLP